MVPEGLAPVDVGDMTSSTGPSKALSASRIATEVWVNAPGLMTMPEALSRLVDPVDDLAFVVGLVRADVRPRSLASACAFRLDIGHVVRP